MSRLAAALFAVVGALGCASPAPLVAAEAPAPPSATVIAPADLFPGGRILLEGQGFLTGTSGETEVEFSGDFGGRAVAFVWPTAEATPQRLALTLSPGVLDALGHGPGLLAGRLSVRVVPRDQPELETGTTVEISVQVRIQPTPTLTALTTDTLPPGGRVAVQGTDLLDPAEGQTTLTLEGEFHPDDGQPTRRIQGAVLSLRSPAERTRGEFGLGAGVLGLSPGVFEGRARLRVSLTDGRTYDSPWLEGVNLVQTPIVLAPPPPLRLARGGVLRVPAEGALPLDASAQTASVLILEGTFSPAGGEMPERWTGAAAWFWVPEDVPDDTELRLALRTQPGPADAPDDTATPRGPGTRAGHFSGTARLVVHAGRERVVTPAVPWEIDLLPMTQAVFLDFRPGFDEGLVLFGLAAASREIRDRVLAVCRRDFAGLRVEFSDAPPADWLEYTTVELGGRDPNGLGLLGLENTARKDVDNRRLDERLGGRNAQSAERGAPPFGGIFLSSFLKLSPGQPDASVVASPAFDAVFSPFSPALNPLAVPWDAQGPPDDAPRGDARKEAVRVLGNLVGGTITHELGHALGLSAVPGRVHNPSDWPGDVMDRGDARPLAERAELGGAAPGRFTGVNAAYLQRLLGEP